MEIKKGLFQKSIFSTERHPIFNIETLDTSTFQRDFSSCKEDVEALIQAYSKQIESAPYFHIEYNANGKANFMEVTSDTENCYTCSFKGLDVFNIMIEKLVEEIDKISPYDRDHWELGGIYFEKLVCVSGDLLFERKRISNKNRLRICLLVTNRIK